MEVWKQSGICEMLEISSKGRVRLRFATRNGRYPDAEGKFKAGYILKTVIKHGYHVIRVTIDGKRKHFFVHRLVCQAFHGNPPSRSYMAAHKNGDQKNNNSSNLYWATHNQNMADRERHQKTMRGDSHYARKLTDKDIPKIRARLLRGEKQTDIAKDYGVSNYAIHDIKRGKSWKHIKTHA